MRKLGTFPDDNAQHFVNYLVAQEMPAQISPAPSGGFDLWIVEEDHFATAKQEFAHFVANPLDPKYRKSSAKADQVRQKHVDRVRSYQKNARAVNQRTTRRAPPISTSILVAAILAFAMSNFQFDYTSPIVQGMAFMFAPSTAEVNSMGVLERQCYNLMRGELWRLVTPALLHMSFAHIVFNMFWLVKLGFSIERREGKWCFIGLVLAAAAIPNFMQAVMPPSLDGSPAYDLGPFWIVPFGGFSGVAYALFGFAWMRGTWKFVPEYFLMPSTVIVAMAWLLLGVLDLDENLLGFRMADWAHCGGLFVGLLFGSTSIGRSATQR
ncbi:MAG: rhomboid family intramembrane serine protease [Planctomycetaceae bacterium]|nr:rhomboid family intramembrane serine protease [Planctomycetaceae bacterium]